MPPKGSKKDKITPVKFAKFFDEFEKVVNDTFAVLHWTDAEIVDEVNDRLDEGDRITKRTFEGWKKQFMDGGLDPVVEHRYFRVYQKALRNCKEKLFGSIVSETHSWQRFAWIMERKFSETWGAKDERKHEDPNEGQKQITITKKYLNQENEK